jgi:mono/diheme cytochrome c family protein
MRGHVVLLASVILWAVASAAAPAQEAGDPRSGYAVAREVCADCHAVERGQPRSPNVSAPTFAVIAAVPGITAAALRVSLHTSHSDRTMPRLIVPPDDLRDVVAYILSLQP